MLCDPPAISLPIFILRCDKWIVFSYSVYEDHTPGDMIAMIEATDPDEGDNQVLMYSILTTGEGERFPISINRNTGVMTNNRTLDREDVDR